MTGAFSPLVNLDAFPDFGLIVKAPTGVRYSNQAAGYACEHPEAEGYFVPLQTRVGRPAATFFDIFGGSLECLDVVQADMVDNALRRQGLKSVRVDRSMLEQSWEAWVHVIVSPDDRELRSRELIPLTGLSEKVRAILIWPNNGLRSGSSHSRRLHRHPVIEESVTIDVRNIEGLSRPYCAVATASREPGR